MFARSLHMGLKPASAAEFTNPIAKEVLKSLANVVDGYPQVRSYRVSNSTFHKIVGR